MQAGPWEHCACTLSSLLKWKRQSKRDSLSQTQLLLSSSEIKARGLGNCGFRQLLLLRDSESPVIGKKLCEGTWHHTQWVTKSAAQNQGKTLGQAAENDGQRTPEQKYGFMLVGCQYINLSKPQFPHL